MLTVELTKQQGDFSLSVQFKMTDSGVMALFGRSGCGKSTIVNLLAGLVSADSGYIKLDDNVLLDTTRRINQPPEHRRIGYVFQDARLFPHYNVEGNLRYGLQRNKQHSVRFQFDTVVQLLGLTPLLLRHTQHLSGGEKQRVALGRALLSQPRLLLLDEPLASLDGVHREELLPYLAQIRDELNIPMIYVSHQFDELLHLATEVLLLQHGQVITQGDLPAISRRPELRSLIGNDALGVVIEGQVQAIDHPSGLAQLAIGDAILNVNIGSLQTGQRLRVQLLARDLILATSMPHGLSVRNIIRGSIVSLTPDEPYAVLVNIDIGGATLVARITTVAASELHLRSGLPIWVLIKTVTLRGHVYPSINRLQQQLT